MNGPDHIASLNPKELIKMIKAVRETEIILGKNKNLFLRAREKIFV